MNAEGLVDRVNGITSVIIGAAQRVSTTLGCGFLEKVYENALNLELSRRSLNVSQQKPVAVRYRGEIVGHYIPDLVVEQLVVVEIKASPGLESIHEAQCLNYLRATGHRICLLLNFGRPRLEVRRIVQGLR